MFKKIVSFITSVPSKLEDVVDKLVHFFTSIWALLVSTAHVLTEAWTWMVHGIEWLGKNIEGWAAWVYNGFSHILFTVIPNAIGYALREAIAWAKGAVHELEVWAKAAVKAVYRWAQAGLDRLEALARGLYRTLLGWVKGPIEWILHVGRHAVELLLHPQALAEYIVAGLIVPLIRWLLRSSVPVLSWLFHTFTAREGEALSLLEDFLSKAF